MMVTLDMNWYFSLIEDAYQKMNAWVFFCHFHCQIGKSFPDLTSEVNPLLFVFRRPILNFGKFFEDCGWLTVAVVDTDCSPNCEKAARTALAVWLVEDPAEVAAFV